MIKKEIKYCYNDIAIEPCIKSNIEHRNECEVLDENGNLPIFASPMSTVVSVSTYHKWLNNQIQPIIPRNVDFEDRKKLFEEGKWVAFGLSEFNDYVIEHSEEIYFHKPFDFKGKFYALIDVANGHMQSVLDAIVSARNCYEDDIVIMAGNIANSESYREYAKAGADYVRVGIGGGAGCITSTQTGIHYPMASLIEDTYKVKCDIKQEYYNEFYKNGTSYISRLPKIVADGGIRNYSDIIKALALGADYVMVGSVFAQLEDSPAEIWYKDDMGEMIKWDSTFVGYKKMYKLYYGMASKKGQEDMFGSKHATAEGTMKFLPMTITIKKWTENMKAYLRSAMSYCGIRDISDFNPKQVDCILISPGAQMSINK